MWQVVLEAPPGVDLPPKVWGTYAKFEDAKAAALAYANFTGPNSGIRINVCQRDSADQLQVFGPHGEKAHRQEPEKVAVGQDLTVIATPARGVVKEPFWTPRED